MTTAGIRVLFVGKSWAVPYDVSVCDKINQLFTQVAQFRPDVLITSGDIPGALNIADFEVRKKWLHIDQNSSTENVVNAIEGCYAANLWGEHRFAKSNPLVSVYTGTFNTGDFLRDTYGSLRDQTIRSSCVASN